MIGTALILRLRRNKTTKAINDFTSNITYDRKRRKKLITNQSYNLIQLYTEIAREVSKCRDEDINILREQLNVSEIVCSILKRDEKNYQVSLFLKKCKKIEIVLIILLLLGIIGSGISVLLRNVVDAYLICFLVWVLSCLSLWITLRLIMKDWKVNQHGKKIRH